jgi:hypothetical protein
MKQLLFGFSVLVVLLAGTPAFAQDDGLFDVNSLFNSGNRDSGVDEDEDVPAATKPDILADLRNWLVKAGAPKLEKNQEGTLKKAYDKEMKLSEKGFEKQFGIPLSTAIAAQTPSRGRGGRGAGRTNPEQAEQIRRISSQLMDKVIAALRLDQQSILRKYQSEQLRASRFDVFTKSMAAAGLPLTPEQKIEVEALYARESRLRTLIIVEAKGQPHQAKVSQLESETTQRIVRLLNQTQKTALAQVMAKSRTR